MVVTFPKDHGGYERRLDWVVRKRWGLAAVFLLLRDPWQRFAREFNRRMDGVSAEFIDKAYRKPQVVLADMVYKGTFDNGQALLEMMKPVMANTALHYAVKSFHRDFPALSVPRGHGSGRRLPLFVFGVDTARYPAPVREPVSDDEDSWPQRVRRGLRELTRLHRRAFWEAVRWWAARGTVYGLYKAVAERAEVDAENRVVWIRPGRAAVRHAPSAATRRQVRRLLQEIRDLLEGGWNGTA